MEFEIIKKSHLKRNIIIGIIILAVISAVVLNFTRAKYRTTQSIPLVNGTINYSLVDLNIVALYINGVEANELDSNTKYTLDTESSICTYKDGSPISNLTLSYDSKTKTFTMSPYTTKGTKCTLYFDESKGASSTIEGLYPNSQLAYDDYDNLRYIGANPNNYVYFNCNDYNNPSSNTCELWRIVGVFSEDTHGISGTKLVKLIHSYSIGNDIWDKSRINNWNTSTLQTNLNTSYLNGSNLGSGKGITAATRNMIETINWKLGSPVNYTTKKNGLASHWYSYERGTTVYSGNPTTWNGKIALMYPSDYGYATGGGNTTSRSSCLAEALANWSPLSDCYYNDWLFDWDYQWTLTSIYSGNNATFAVWPNGYVSFTPSDAGIGVRPSVYLKANIEISDGDGTNSNPYILSANE